MRNFSRRESNLENLSYKKGKNTEDMRETQIAHHTLNTNSGGFIGGGGIISARKGYAR